MEIVAATNNAHKLKEMRELFEGSGHTLISLAEAGFSGEIVEDGDTFEANALIKARTVHKATGANVIADDSGICVDALNGGPGVHSARYGGEGLDDAGRRHLLLRSMEQQTNRAAHFACVIACVFADGSELTAEGIVRGELTREERGEGGFGYDSIFYYPPFGATTAEISEEQKNAISHRGAAIRAFLTKLADKEKQV